jgi:SAM-dependent methyltransferase
MEYPWFKDWFNSPYYHRLYFNRDEKEAAAFIDKLIHYLQPPAGAGMMDVACGKGRHSRLLAAKGYFVTGIDLSEASIIAAKAYENDHLEFYQHDMRLPFRINYFDYIFNFFTSFGYFKSRREHDDAIRTLANALKPGGTFVIDYLNVHYVEDHLVPSEELEIDGTRYFITRKHDDTHFYKTIRVSDAALPQMMEYTEKVTKFSLGDFNDMLAYQGLQIQEVFGDYQFGHYDIRKSPRLIIVAKKL